MRVNQVLHILTLKSNSKGQEKNSYKIKTLSEPKDILSKTKENKLNCSSKRNR